MIAAELLEVYGDGPNELNKCMKLSTAFTSPETPRVNVLGIIISSTLPKPCAPGATHKYCCSFFIIDPFYQNPASPICVNLFMDDPNRFHPAYIIGDVIMCQRVRLQRYKEFPQLVGNFEKSTLIVFRNKKQEALPLGLGSQEETDNRRGLLQNEDWELLNYTIKPATLTDVDSNLSIAVIHLSNWAFDFFKSHSMANISSFPHCNIHSMLYHYSIFHNKQDAYRQVFPPNIQSRPAPTLNGAIGPELSKIDVIGLVVSNTKGTEATPTRILLWDGTGNGYYPCIPGAARHVATIDRAMQSAADAAEIWHQFVQRGKLLNPQSDTSALQSPNAFASASASSQQPWDKDLFLGSFFVIESHDPPGQSLHREFLTNFQPGKWIRLRSITVSNKRTDFDVPVGEVRADSHVSFLQSFFRDVCTVIGDYFVRIHQHLSIQEYQKIQEQQQQLAELDRQPVAANTAATSASVPPPVQGHISHKGHPQTSLAWILALPAPPADKLVVEFFVAGAIVSWFPTDVSKFVQTVINEDGSTKRSYLFSLQIFDSTQPAQVIFADREAERLLGGISAEEFATNPSYAEQLAEKLQEARSTKAVVKSYIRLYTKNLTLPASKSLRGGRSTTAKKRAVKRMLGFDAVAPFHFVPEKVVPKEVSSQLMDQSVEG